MKWDRVVAGREGARHDAPVTPPTPQPPPVTPPPVTPPPAPARTELPPWLTYCDNPSCQSIPPVIAAVCPAGDPRNPARTTKVIPQVDGFPISGAFLHFDTQVNIRTRLLSGNGRADFGYMFAYSASSIKIKSDMDFTMSYYNVAPVWGGTALLQFVSSELESATLHSVFYRHPSYNVGLTDLHAKAQQIIQIERDMTGRTSPKTTAYFIPTEMANTTIGEGHFSFGNGTITVNYGNPPYVAATGGITKAPLARFSHEYAHELFAANLRGSFPDNYACPNEGLADAVGFMSGFLPVEDFGPIGLRNLNFEDGCQEQTAQHDVGNCPLWHVKKAGKLTPAFIRGLFHPQHTFVFDSCTHNVETGNNLWVYYQEAAGGADMMPALDAAKIPHSLTFADAKKAIGIAP